MNYYSQVMPRKLRLTVHRKNEFRKRQDAKKKARECVVSVPVQNVDVTKVAVPLKFIMILVCHL